MTMSIKIRGKKKHNNKDIIYAAQLLFLRRQKAMTRRKHTSHSTPIEKSDERTGETQTLF